MYLRCAIDLQSFSIVLFDWPNEHQAFGHVDVEILKHRCVISHEAFPLLDCVDRIEMDLLLEKVPAHRIEEA
jgi:hypothetical protein